MREVLLNVLNVGQGLCSVVTGTKDNGEPYCGIFDCGTLAYNPVCSRQQTLAQIGNLICKTGQPVITDIVISHQDIDHWSMLMDILSGYFGMKKGWLYRKNKFVYTMAAGGARLFSFSLSRHSHAYFEGWFEKEKSVQKLDYTIREDERVSEFYYEGTFYEEGKQWEISVSDNAWLFNYDGKSKLTVDLACRSDTGEVIAKVYYEIRIPLMEIEVYPELMNRILGYVVNNKIYFDENRFGRADKMYLRGHIRAACDLVQNDQHSFSDIYDIVTSVPDNTPVKPIQNLVWGGAKPSSKCKLAQKIMSHMCDNGFIERFSEYPDGGYFVFQEDELCDIESFDERYDSDMEDAHGETMQQLNIKRNATSVVTCMTFAHEGRFLFPGDLTVHRFEWLRDVVIDEEPYAVSVMTAPHHGSDVTNFCILHDNEHIQPLHLLLDLFQNDTQRIFVVSALLSKFGHPGKDFMTYAVGYASDGSMHNICYGEEVQKGRSITCQRKTEMIAQDVYCTEMTDLYGYCYPPVNDAAGARLLQAPRITRKIPSKRLFI